MKKLTSYYFRFVAAVLVLALLCVSGCTGGKSTSVDEDRSGAYYQEYAEYFENDEILNGTIELAEITGDSWYRDGDPADDSGEYGWLLGYEITAHTQDGRGVFALHVPGSAGMSQEDFILLTTDDYGKTWTPGSGVYHIVGSISQITINENYIYIVVDSGAYGNSYILMSDDFGASFKTCKAGCAIPEEHQERMSELFGVYTRIVNVESNGDMVLKCFCVGDVGYISFDDLSGYDDSDISDGERTLLIMSSDAYFSEVKTLYADKRIF